MATIEVTGWIEPPDDETIRALTGSVVSTPIAAEWGPEPMPFLELFRFARVIAVEALPTGSDETPPCPRCESPARHRIVVEWEADYASPDGNVLCENCVQGVATTGADVIRFGADDSLKDRE
jgi:hypothetical protein